MNYSSVYFKFNDNEKIEHLNKFNIDVGNIKKKKEMEKKKLNKKLNNIY